MTIPKRRLLQRLANRRSQRGFLNMHIAAIAARRRSSGPSGGLLGSYTANVWGGFALVQLWTSWSGNLIRVRRSSDNAEQDIGQSAGVLDTASLATFVGASDAFIVTWYDQTGNGNDLSQATTSKQPMIVDAGTYMLQVYFDGVDDNLRTANNSGTPTGVTFFSAGRSRLADSATAKNVAYHAGTVSAFLTAGRLANATGSGGSPYYFVEVNTNTSGFSGYGIGFGANDGTTYAARFDLTQSSAAAELGLYYGGSTQSLQTTSGTDTGGTFDAGAWVYGGDTNSFNRMGSSAFLVYESAMSNADISAVSALIKPAAPTLGLDSYTTGLWGVYSLRKQLTAFAGSSIRVRRSSDNTEQDIGFSSGLLDTASLLSFAGAGSAFVTKWYDQSGGAHDLAQATTGNQPRIVNAGAMDIGVLFDGSDDILVSGNSGTPSAFTVFSKAFSTSSAVQVLFEQNTNEDSVTGAALYTNTAFMWPGCSLTSSANRARASYITYPVGQIVCTRLDRSQATAATKTTLWSGGAQLSIHSTDNAGNVTGNFVAAPWYVGARATSLFPFVGWMETLVIYESAISDANIERISRQLG